MEVYFDDFKVTQTKSPVIETSDYYPFGAIASSYQRENSLVNRYKFESKEYQDDLGLNLYNFHWRQYDPWAPHTTTIDPHAENYFNFSPYSWALNNPVNYTDPDGKDVIFDISRNKKGEITGVSLRATVYITGEGASSERASELNAAAGRIYKPGTSKNGVAISFNVSYKYSKDISEGGLKAGENMLTFHKEKGTSKVNSETTRTTDRSTHSFSEESTAGRTGDIYGADRFSDADILHETLHFTGLSDRYNNEVNGKPDEGFENDIMGKRGSTDINGAHYDNFGINVKTVNPTSPNYLNRKKIDRDSRGNVVTPSKNEIDKKK